MYKIAFSRTVCENGSCKRKFVLVAQTYSKTFRMRKNNSKTANSQLVYTNNVQFPCKNRVRTRCEIESSVRLARRILFIRYFVIPFRPTVSTIFFFFRSFDSLSFRQTSSSRHIVMFSKNVNRYNEYQYDITNCHILLPFSRSRKYSRENVFYNSVLPA